MKNVRIHSIVAAAAIAGAALFVIHPLQQARSAPAGETATATTPTVMKHVVIVVFDGLRPDTVNMQDTPTLATLAQTGTIFANNHSVYFSSTEVNGTALATGGAPRHTNIMANVEYRPEVELMKPIAMEAIGSVRTADFQSGNKFIGMPTVAEILQQQNIRTVIAGTKPVALLLNRYETGREGTQSVSLVEGHTLPPAAQDDVKKGLGNLPKKADAKKDANAQQDAWTTKVLTEKLWADGVPAFTTLWLSEPDYCQHGSGPNTVNAKAALKSSDDNLAVVLKKLETLGVRGQTDVIVVSDHGFSTVSKNCLLADDLNATGKFKAFTSFKETDKPARGDILVVGNGGSTCIYVVEQDEPTIKRLVEFLQTTEYAGVIFSRKAMPGTFDLARAQIDTATAPDVVVSMRWTEQTGADGLAGSIWSEGTKRKPGEGNHTSLSRHDMHNTLIANGPSFRAFYTSQLPSGNFDVAPTVLHILGVTSPTPMDGRVLSEALLDSRGAAEKIVPPVTKRQEATVASSEGTWKQYLQITTYEDREYIDEGNGSFEVGATAKP